jgi:cell division protein FtsI/penicillin-binding protein 2
MPERRATFNTDRRLQAVGGAALIMLAILFYRLFDLQVIRHGYFDQVATAQRQSAAQLTPHRGAIYLSEDQGREQFPVASNKQGWIVYAVPRDMKNPEEVATTLAPALVAFQRRQEERLKDILENTGQNRVLPTPTASPDVTPSPSAEPTPTPTVDEQIATVRDRLLQKLDQKQDPYEPLIKPYEVIDDEFKAFLDAHPMPGVVVQDEQVREYPEGTLAAHVLGYVGYQGQERSGKYGIEGNFNAQLEGTSGWFSGEKDAKGNLIGVSNRIFEAAQDGDDVVLTIDRVVQSIIEQELKAGVEKYRAERGSVLVMDPDTGAVLGMATYPTYDPNYYYDIKDPHVQVNPVVSDLFEPGSILKPVIMAGAIEQGLVTPNTTMVDNGPVHIGKFTINTFDGKHRGVQTMTQVLEQSNNVGMVWVGQQMKAEMLYDYLRRFGVGEKTGIELEGETQSTLTEPQRWSDATVATTSFGQGVVLTPIQALNAINAIANGGKLMQPYIVSKVQHSNGGEIDTKPTVVRQVVSPGTSSQVSAMMVSVIENGVGALGKVPGYYLAGKTGTAQVADGSGKYSLDRKIISFTGFGPAEKPKFSILIKLDNPAGLSFASGTAAPMFHNIAQKLLNYYQIAPDYDSTKKQSTFTVPDASTPTKHTDKGA